MADIELRAFVAAGVRELGGLADEPKLGALDLILPEALGERLGGRQYLRLDPACEALTVESPIVDAVAGALAQAGCAAQAYLNPVYLQGGDLETKWARAFRLPAGRCALAALALEETTHALFHFRATYETDEKEERLYAVAVNLTTRAPYDAIAQEWPRLFLDEAPAYGELVKTAAPKLADLKKPLEKTLRRAMAPDIEALRATQEKFMGRELRRLEQYYGTLEAELDERGRRPSSQGQAVSLAERRRAVALDRAKKVRDAVEKHRLRVEAEAFALLFVHQPWLRATMRLESRRETLERPFFWNPALKAFAPAACDVCAEETTALCLRGGRLLCPSCAGGGD